MSRYVIQCQIGDAVWFLTPRGLLSSATDAAKKFRTEAAAIEKLAGMAKAGGALFSVVCL